MNFMKKLYMRLAPWYDEQRQAEKEIAARNTVNEVRSSISYAESILHSYHRYDKAMVSNRRSN